MKIFVGCGGARGGVRVLEFDPDTGYLSGPFKGQGVDLPDATFLARCGDTNVVAAVQESHAKVALLQCSPTSLVAENLVTCDVPFAGPCHVSAIPVASNVGRNIGGGEEGEDGARVDRYRLFVSCYDGGGLCVLEAGLSPVSLHCESAWPTTDLLAHGAPAPEFPGPHRERQDAPHCHSATPLPGGRGVLVSDLGLDMCFVVPSGSDSRATSVTLPRGSGPRHSALLDRKGSLAAVVGEIDSTLNIVQLPDLRGSPDQGTDPEPRVLVASSRTRFGAGAGEAELGWASEVAVVNRSNGERDVEKGPTIVLVANREREREDEDRDPGSSSAPRRGSLASFTWDPASRELAQRDIQATLGPHPRHFAVVGSGRWALVANRFAGRIQVFSIGSDGALTPSAVDAHGTDSLSLQDPCCILPWDDVAPVE